MKQRYYCCILFFLGILQCYAQIQVTVNLSPNEYSITKEKDFERINYGYQFYTDSVGYPEIPIIHRLYAIPIDATNVSLQIGSCNTIPLLENCIIYPVQHPQICGNTNEIEFITPDSIIYNQTLPYPNIEARIVSDKRHMGFRIIEIELYPFVYIPNNKILHRRDISCTLNYSSEESKLFYAPKISEQRALSARSYIASLVENSEDVMTTSVTSTNKARTADPNFSVQKNVIPDYLIITNEELKSEFQRLADWKTKKGVPTIIKTVEEIKKEYFGADLVDKIRNFIVEFRNQWGEEGLYLLLGGDINIVPSRMALSSAYPQDKKSYPTDACYVDEEFTITNWETEEWESSRLRNICIGRLPASTKQEVNNYINKLILYEKNDLNTDFSYIQNLLMASGFLKDSCKYGAMNNLDSYRKGFYPSRFKYWYLFDHFNCNCTEHNKTYTQTYGDELSRNNFIAALNGEYQHGYFHIICHDEHGHTFQLGTSTNIKGEGVTKIDLNEIEDSIHQNIIISGSCNTANFSQDCIGWNFIKKGNSIAYIGNSDIGYSTEVPLFSKLLSHLYYDRKNPKIGYVHLESIQKNFYKVNDAYHRRHLLGDPEMPIWTDTPQTLEVSVSPEYAMAHHSESTEITVKINNLPSGKSATLCIMKDTEIYKVLTIDDTEEHTFYFTPLTGGDIYVTVTAKNFIPFEAIIPVQAIEPTLTIDSIAFLSGNNGIVSPREEVRMNISIKNDGLFTSDYVTAQLYTESPYINIIKNKINYGRVQIDEPLTTTENFIFTVASNAPDILRKDFNAVTFYLSMSKENGGYDVDTFRVDLISPKYKIVSHFKITDTPIAAGGTYTFVTDFVKTGKKSAPNLHVEIEALSSDISSISYLNEKKWSVTIRDSHQTGNPLRLKAKLYSDTLPLDSSIIDLTDNNIAVSDTIVKFKSNENSITFYWLDWYEAYGYNIYRSEAIEGPYTRLNQLPLTGNYYIDEELETAKEFYYKISAINSSLVEGALSSPIKAWTIYPTSGLYPLILATNQQHKYEREATTADFDYNGQKEIVLMAQFDNNSKIVIANADGTEPFDIDRNVTTLSGFANIPWIAEATPTVADIYGKGETCVIALTRNRTHMDRSDNHIICYSTMDTNGDLLPDILWSRETNSSFYRSAIVTDINSPDGKGEKEIIVRSDEGTYYIRIYDCRGNLLRTIGEGVLEQYYGNICVADLNNDDYKEIIATSSNNIYVWNYDGTLKDNKILFTNAQSRSLKSSPIVCDFDNDGKKDIIVASNTNPSYIYVVNQEGTCFSGFDGSSATASIPYATLTHGGYSHNISVGDINMDGNLEIVALGTGFIRVWNNDGTLCFNREIEGLFPNTEGAENTTVPILADVDGDESIDIVFNVDNKIYAIDNQGFDIAGFPLSTIDPISVGVCVSDIDNDGLNEIIAGDRIGFIFVWKTFGKSTAIEWGRAQFDTENTSEYVSGYKDPWVITSNTTWTGGTFTNDIIVRAGTFTIPQGVTLDMRKPYRIYVMNGGKLNVVGGRITNADIVVKSGGTLNVAGNSQIILRTAGGNLQVDKGAVMNMPLGTVR